MAEFEDLAVTGELISAMPESERWFEIVEKPSYEKIQTQGDPEGDEKKKLFIKVKLSNGQIASYYPNRTSSRRIATLTREGNMDKWVGKKFSWGEVTKQKVAGNMKNILFVTDFYPKTEKV